MSFAARPMWAATSAPTTKVPISITTLISYVLPPVLCYFVMAILVVIPGTHTLRLALCLVLLLLAWRAAFSVDMALSHFERKFDNDLANPMLMIVVRSLYWAWTKEPLVRQPHTGTSQSNSSILMDAIDLALAFRGIGWDWSSGMYVPRETRPSKRTAFLSHTALSAVVHALICGTSHRALRSFSPVGLGFISGGSIFDETLPFHVQYLRATTISLIGCIVIYTMLQMNYDLCTLVGVLVLGQDPAQWPPGFDSPWLSTSIAQFWGRRWHQWLRHIFLVLGGYPLSFIFGRAGYVIGAFLASGVYHYVGISSLDNTSELWRMLVGFGMMAPGIFAERAFKWLTGRKVCGLPGWIWTMTWLALWGNVIIDGFVRAGLFRLDPLIDVVPPLRMLVERLVMDFDTWLRAL